MLLADEKGADADRRGRHARHADRVPRQGPRRHGLDLPHPAAASAASWSTRAGVMRLYRSRISAAALLLLVIAALVAVVAALAASDPGGPT